MKTEHVVGIAALGLFVAVVGLAATRGASPGWRSVLDDTGARLGAAVSGTFTPPRRDSRWAEHVALVDQALAAGDVSTALRAWQDAYGAALASGEWRSMIAIGDLFVRLGRTAGTGEGAKPNARRAYLMALTRARRDRSVEGTLRTAEAFAALGDREVATACLRISTRLADEDQDRAAIERVREVAARLES